MLKLVYTNTGGLSGINLKFIDTIPVGTTENPQTGITLGNITGNGIHTITFKVVVN